MAVDAGHRVGPFRYAPDDAGPRTATARSERVEDWRDLLREHFVALDVADVDRTTATDFPSAVRSSLVGHLSVAEVASQAQSCVRTAQLAGSDPERYLQIGMVRAGRAVVEQDGRQAEVPRGRFVVYETERPFAWHFDGPWRLLVLTWPRELIELDAAESRRATARTRGDAPLEQVVGRLLADTALDPPPTDTPTEVARQLAGELTALVTCTLGLGEHDTGDEALSERGAADLRRRVAAYAAEHVEEPDLGVERLAALHHVSLRTLYRAFAGADLTPAWMVRRLRLAHARARLVDPRDAELSLTDLAQRCGFSDLPRFSHAFKDAYGEAPSAYRRRRRPGGPGAATGAPRQAG